MTCLPKRVDEKMFLKEYKNAPTRDLHAGTSNYQVINAVPPGLKKKDSSTLSVYIVDETFKLQERNSCSDDG